MRVRWALVLIFVLTLGATFYVYRHVPQAFVPEEDQGYFIVQVQAPAGASLEYTSKAAAQAEQVLMKDPDVLALFSVMGFSFSGAAPNQGIMFVRLKEFKDRTGDTHSLQAVLRRVTGPLFGIPGAIVVAFTPPSIPGLSRFGGFEFQVLDQTGTNIQTLAQGTQGIVAAANRSPKLRGLFSPFTVNDPQLQVTIDRAARAGDGAAAQRSHQRAADLPRIAVRQRLRVQQPRVSRVRAGRSALPHERDRR